MVTFQEYAALSAFIYNDQRGGEEECDQVPNRLEIPTGWVALGTLLGADLHQLVL